jgi:hypothetical protein
LQDALDAALYAAFFFVENLLLPGRIENWILVINLDNLSVSKLPINFIKHFLKTMQAHLKCRGRAIVALKVTWALRAIWSVVSPFVDDRIKKKVTMTKEPTHPILTELIHPKQLEQKFGGDAEDIIEYWPPREVSEEYGYDPDRIFEDSEESKDEFDNEDSPENFHIENSHG